jgi:putative component of toxin-antitoxin plasmid stabilization module
MRQSAINDALSQQYFLISVFSDFCIMNNLLQARRSEVWFESLRDMKITTIILSCHLSAERGHSGDCKRGGHGVCRSGLYDTAGYPSDHQRRCGSVSSSDERRVTGARKSKTSKGAYNGAEPQLRGTYEQIFFI